MLARVNDVHEVNPHEDALSSTLRNVLPFGTKYAGEGHSTVIYRVVECEPLEVILDDEDKILEIRSGTACRVPARQYSKREMN